MYEDIAVLNYQQAIRRLRSSKFVSALRRVITIDDTSGLNVLRPGDSHLMLQYSYDEGEELLMLTERVNLKSEEDITEVKARLAEICIEGYHLTLDVSDFKEYLDVNLIDSEVYDNALSLYGGTEKAESEI